MLKILSFLFVREHFLEHLPKKAEPQKEFRPKDICFICANRICSKLKSDIHPKGALTCGPVVPYGAEARMSPLASPPLTTLTLLQPNHTWALLNYLIYRARPIFLPSFLKIVLWFLSSTRQSQIFPLLFMWTFYAAACLNLRWILKKQP